MGYNEEKQLETAKKTREILSELPPFVTDFFVGINQATTANTRYAYAVNLKNFFWYMETLAHKSIHTEEDLDTITEKDIEQYIYYITDYEKDGKKHHNGAQALSRKLAALRRFYNYYFRRKLITTNPPLLVDKPKIAQKSIICLDAGEVASFLDVVESGKGLTEKQKIYHEQNKLRDLAIATLLLATGIRVSECVGINRNEIDFNNNCFTIIAKGQDERRIYFNEEAEKAIKDYLNTRYDDCEALFVANLSENPTRISVKTVRRIVKKYSTLVVGKALSPHKLRSSFATNLYEETGDIALVAECLGHKDVNTTKKHYARVEEGRRREAARKVRMR